MCCQRPGRPVSAEGGTLTPPQKAPRASVPSPATKDTRPVRPPASVFVRSAQRTHCRPGDSGAGGEMLPTRGRVPRKAAAQGGRSASRAQTLTSTPGASGGHAQEPRGGVGGAQGSRPQGGTPALFQSQPLGGVGAGALHSAASGVFASLGWTSALPAPLPSGPASPGGLTGGHHCCPEPGRDTGCVSGSPVSTAAPREPLPRASLCRVALWLWGAWGLGDQAVAVPGGTCHSCVCTFFSPPRSF